MSHEILPPVPDFYESDPTGEFEALLAEVHKRFEEVFDRHDLTADQLSFVNDRVDGEVQTTITLAEMAKYPFTGDILFLTVPVEAINSRRPTFKAYAPYFYVKLWSPDQAHRQLLDTKIDQAAFQDQYLGNATPPIADLFRKVSLWTRSPIVLRPS